MLLFVAAAAASQPDIHPHLAVQGTSPRNNAEDVPADAAPFVVFDVRTASTATVRLVDEATGETVAEVEQALDVGYAAVEVDPDVALEAGASYRFEIEADVFTVFDGSSFTVGESSAPVVSAPELLEDDSVGLSYYDDALHGSVEARIDATAADDTTLLLFDTNGGLAGAAFPVDGEEVESIDVWAQAAAFAPEACFTLVARDPLGGEAGDDREVCFHVEDGRGLSCSTASAPLGLGLVALGGLFAGLRRRR